MASRWVLWLTQKDTLTGGQSEFVYNGNGVLSLCRGRVQVLVSKLQAHLSLLCFGYYKLHLSFVSCFLLAFSVQDIGEGLKGREKGLFCLCHSGNSPSFRHHLGVPASALGDTPSTSLTAPPPQSSLFSSRDNSEPLGLINCSLFPLFPQP